MGSDETAHDSHVAVLAACWRSQTLGVAFLEDDGTLRWLSVADASPDFRVLQAVKYTTSPGTILAPASSDPDWMDALGASAMGGASGPEPGPDQDGTASVEAEYHVVVTKARDFTADAAYKRLALCHNLVGLPDRELTEKELLVYLEHLIPREQQVALLARRRPPMSRPRAPARVPEVIAGPMRPLCLRRHCEQSGASCHTCSARASARPRSPPWSRSRSSRTSSSRRKRSSRSTSSKTSITRRSTEAGARKASQSGGSSTEPGRSPASGCCARGSHGPRRRWES